MSYNETSVSYPFVRENQVQIFSHLSINSNSNGSFSNLYENGSEIGSMEVSSSSAFWNNTTGNANVTVVELPIDMQFNDGHLLAILVYSVLMCFSAIGNMSVLSAILRLRLKQRRLSTVHLLLLHLCTADLIVTLLMMPLEIAWNATVSWKGGDFLCRLLSFSRIFGLYLSSFLLICISVDRYYAIVHPLKSLADESHRRARLMLAAAWMTSFVCSLPQPFIFHLESHPTFPWYEQCVTFNFFSSPEYELAYNFFGFGFLYGLPLVTILLCYSRILCKIYRINPTSEQQRRCSSVLRRSNLDALGRAKVRTLKMTILIVLTFCLTWGPYNIMCLWYWLDPKSASQVDQRVQKVLFLFACTNSCMNPLIYGLFHFNRRKGQRSTVTKVTITTPLNGSSYISNNLYNANKSLKK